MPLLAAIALPIDTLLLPFLTILLSGNPCTFEATEADQARGTFCQVGSNT
jgi:hypothetical protein